jgi:hypothetical protein
MSGSIELGNTDFEEREDGDRLVTGLRRDLKETDATQQVTPEQDEKLSKGLVNVLVRGPSGKRIAAPVIKSKVKEIEFG